MEKESVDDCLSYFSILGCRKESGNKSETIQSKIGDKKKIENHKSKNSIRKTISNTKKNNLIRDVNSDNDQDDQIEVEKEEEDDEVDFSLLESSNYLRIPSVSFEKWYNEYFDVSPDINLLD